VGFSHDENLRDFIARHGGAHKTTAFLDTGKSGIAKTRRFFDVPWGHINKGCVTIVPIELDGLAIVYTLKRVDSVFAKE